MMPAFIFVCSITLLLQFFVSYCRSLIAASARQPLSREVQDVIGIQKIASGEDFPRVVQLLHLCPESPDDRSRLQAVGAYFGMLNFLRSTIAQLMPALRSWTEVERAHCTYFAAVTLERRIAFSRDMLAQQMDS
jgi:hypothetical protein